MRRLRLLIQEHGLEAYFFELLRPTGFFYPEALDETSTSPQT